MDIDFSCPHCLRIDTIQNVEALRTEGISTSYSTANYTGVGVSTAGLLPVIGTEDVERTHVTALAQKAGVRTRTAISCSSGLSRAAARFPVSRDADSIRTCCRRTS
ncbi:hypothetical protein [Nocardia brasiliensis]|uniref:hypothetical protein n=1 Tax=Nocardia brasiliensis TaxID=37326 RepID=UPI003D8D88E1